MFAMRRLRQISEANKTKGSIDRASALQAGADLVGALTSASEAVATLADPSVGLAAIALDDCRQISAQSPTPTVGMNMALT
jgi:hypothetical protein